MTEIYIHTPFLNDNTHHYTSKNAMLNIMLNREQISVFKVNIGINQFQQILLISETWKSVALAAFSLMHVGPE